MTRKRMFSICLIGPDGVGKTTISRKIEHTLNVPVKYIYMGVNPDASNIMLPTTRWWEQYKLKKRRSPINRKSDDIGQLKGSRFLFARIFKVIFKPTFGLINNALEEYFRLLVAYWYARRGYLILYDRYFLYDFYFPNKMTDKNKISMRKTAHWWILHFTHSNPNLVILLDAPGKVAFTRKGEFSPDELEFRRNQYHRLENTIPNFVLVNANRSFDAVFNDVKNLINQSYNLWKNDAGQL